MTQLTITLNGETITTGATILSTLLAEHNITAHSTGVAVAVNSTLVTKDIWGKTFLTNGDSIDIVKPFAGGY